MNSYFSCGLAVIVSLERWEDKKLLIISISFLWDLRESRVSMSSLNASVFCFLVSLLSLLLNSVTLGPSRVLSRWWLVKPSR